MQYKNYLIELDKPTTTYIIRHTGKGSLPAVMSGRFTTQGLAMKVIDSYVEAKKVKTEGE